MTAPASADDDPDDPGQLQERAAACQAQGRFVAALRLYDRLIDRGAATAEIWLATGNALTAVGEYGQAVAAYEQSLRLDQARAETHHQLARVLYRLGDADAAAHHLQSALDRGGALASWLSMATAIPGCPAADLQRILEVRTACARQLATDLAVSPAITRHRPAATGIGSEPTTAESGESGCQEPVRPPRQADRRRRPGAPAALRIGYLSAYFQSANYMKPVWGLVNHHDRDAFQIHLFSDSPPVPAWTGYRPHPADHIHDTTQLDIDSLAALIESVGIDVLVDLNGYSIPERLALFLGHPAPVMVAWFNMYATSGLPGFDYLVGDDQVVLPGEERFFSEHVIRLPVSYLTFQVDHAVPPVVPPPCQESGFLTFGSLVAQYKITPPVLDAWASILQRAPDARLLLANTALQSLHNRQYVAEQFAHRSVRADRLTLCGPAEHLAFLHYYDRIDVALDAFPYNGGTTTMEAIWQGVPVLTFAGDRWASRTSASLLRRSHLAEFVADGPAGMVTQAVGLARSPDTPRRLSHLRSAMRARLVDDSACDTPALARSMEDFYRAVAVS